MSKKIQSIITVCVSRFAHVFMMDTGASVKGDLSGHTKAINSVSWKPTRPFRIATGSEDNKSAFYEGPPFVFKCTKAVSIYYLYLLFIYIYSLILTCVLLFLLYSYKGKIVDLL